MGKISVFRIEEERQVVGHPKIGRERRSSRYSSESSFCSVASSLRVNGRSVNRPFSFSMSLKSGCPQIKARGLQKVESDYIEITLLAVPSHWD
jgi:hypothetical protein